MQIETFMTVFNIGISLTTIICITICTITMLRPQSKEEKEREKERRKAILVPIDETEETYEALKAG